MTLRSVPSRSPVDPWQFRHHEAAAPGTLTLETRTSVGRRETEETNSLLDIYLSK